MNTHTHKFKSNIHKYREMHTWKRFTQGRCGWRGEKKVLFPFGILGNQGWDKTTTVRCWSFKGFQNQWGSSSAWSLSYAEMRFKTGSRPFCGNDPSPSSWATFVPQQPDQRPCRATVMSSLPAPHDATWGRRQPQALSAQQEGARSAQCSYCLLRLPFLLPCFSFLLYPFFVFVAWMYF